jgi:hypothetical protein
VALNSEHIYAILNKHGVPISNYTTPQDGTRKHSKTETLKPE